MKTIAFFSAYYLPHTGGVERYEYNLAKQLANKNIRVIIVTTKYDNSLESIENTEYAKIYRLPIYSIFSGRYPILKKNKEYKELINQLKTEKIDYCILNTRFWLTTLIGAKFAKQQNIPRCVIEHGSSHFTVYNKFLDFFGERYEHILTNKVKKYVTDFYGVSQACCKWLEHFNIKAKGVLTNAIDISEYEKHKNDINKSSNNIQILYAGRLIKDKGVLLLVQAFEELKKKYNSITLNLAGDGALYEELKNNESINLLGRLERVSMMKQYAKTDVFVSPSCFPEGLPTTILEAGLMKCAVIATNMGGTAEVVEHEKQGLICEANVEDISKKLEELIKNQDMRRNYAENLHEKIVSKYSWGTTVGEILKIIEEGRRICQ